MSNSKLPQLNDFRYPTTSPTKILDQSFTIEEINDTQYEDTPQIELVGYLHSTGEKTVCYVSNSVCMRFLKALKPVLHHLDKPIYFFKSSPSNRYYEIGYSDEPLFNPSSNSEIPF